MNIKSTFNFVYNFTRRSILRKRFFDFTESLLNIILDRNIVRALVTRKLHIMLRI